MPDEVTRRELMRRGALMVGAVTGATAVGCAPEPAPLDIALRAPDANGVMSPQGFASRVVARTGDRIGNYTWHMFPDGGAVFPHDDGWIYVSNSEFVPGGVGAIEFDGTGAVVGARPILRSFTLANCAGGAMPWGTWLSCEEWNWGRVWECDPTGRRPAVERPGLGSFRHEAAAADPVGRAIYLTEDHPEGCLYRFVPAVWGDLRRGELSVACHGPDSSLTWTRVPRPNPGLLDAPTRNQVPGAATFDGGEGIGYRDGHVFFATKGDDRVWDLDTSTMRVTLRYDRATSTRPELSGVDNLLVGHDGSIVVAEDGGNLELVLSDGRGRATPVMRLVGHDGSEITGPAFDPSGTRLYFSSQRGTDGRGVTFELAGPFRQLRDAIGRS